MQHHAINTHGISQLMLFYEQLLHVTLPDVNVQFHQMQEIFDGLNILPIPTLKSGKISLSGDRILTDAKLQHIHRSIGDSSSLTSQLFLSHYSVRKFFMNFSPNDVNTINESRKTHECTAVEVAVTLFRMLNAQMANQKYPDVQSTDLPYRSPSWVNRLIKYLDDNVMIHLCGDENKLNDIQRIFGDVIETIDAYERALEDGQIGN